MRRSICYSEPGHCQAGEISTWKFCYTTAISLPKGTKIKFDLQSKGRSLDWQTPDVTPKAKKNAIWMEMPDGKAVYAKEIEGDINPTPAFEFVLPGEIKAGDALTIFMGSPSKKAEGGSQSQTYIQRRRPFYLYIDPKGKSDYKEPEIFSMDIRGGSLSNIRILSPSIVARNQRFDVTVRFEDSFGNLTSNAQEGTLIELSYEHLRENLSWKLFVPETGFINIPNLYFNEPGIYRIQLKNLFKGDSFFSYPIKCLAESEKSLYWGLLHGESEKIDSSENIESCLRYFRDEKAFQFYGVSPFESTEETSNDMWKSISHHVAEFDEDGRFVTFLGFQWHGDSPEEGVRNFIYTKDAKPIMRKKESKTSGLKKIYKSSNPKDFMAIPSFSMAKGFETEFEQLTPEFERVVEIYNAWGCSECSEKQGNLRPIKTKGKKGVMSSNKGSIVDALNEGARFGFIAGGLDDRGIYSEFYENDQVQYSPGLTAIFAPEQTRESLFQALYNRNCYATTGPRIIVGYSIAGADMGSELNTKAKPGLSFNRHIVCYVASNSKIESVSIIRNGEVIKEFKPSSTTLEFAYDDMEPIQNCLITDVKDRPPFLYYYLRVVQEDGHIAWASPIWIDHTDSGNHVLAVKKTSVKKTKK